MLKSSSASAAPVADAGACSGECRARNSRRIKELETRGLLRPLLPVAVSPAFWLTWAKNRSAGAPSHRAKITLLLNAHGFSHPSMTSPSGQYRVSLLRDLTGERESPPSCFGRR